MNTSQTILVYIVYFLTFVSAIGMTILCTFLWFWIIGQVFSHILCKLKERKSKKKAHAISNMINTKEVDIESIHNEMLGLSFEDRESIFRQFPDTRLPFLRFLRKRDQQRI